MKSSNALQLRRRPLPPAVSKRHWVLKEAQSRLKRLKAATRKNEPFRAARILAGRKVDARAYSLPSRHIPVSCHTLIAEFGALLKLQCGRWTPCAVAHAQDQNFVVLDRVENQIRIAPHRDHPNAGLVFRMAHVGKAAELRGHLANASDNLACRYWIALMDIGENGIKLRRARAW